jgi:diaminohydroxyphosphoribosylaminopyrimidine deaminase/5-amino-6-(5-phosphoribosylamino)uracil reductase
MNDERWMDAALQEARRGRGQTSPNPMVGAVIVRGDRELARGFHRCVGEPHAEVEALRALPSPELARGATLYVTLEPCSTHGRTPPCVEAILRAGLARVVVGAIDPNPRHAGRGVDLLRAAGVEVTVGVRGAECAELNAAFNQWICTGMPWVTVKVGMSLDGRLARPPGEGQWLTSEESRADAMALRAEADAVLIGANTLRLDNPRLTVRGIEGARQPWRVVLAGKGELPEDAHLFTDEWRDRTLVFRGKTLRAVLRELGRRQITRVLVEGGMRVIGQAFDRCLVQEAHFYVAPLLCGGPVLAVGGRGAGSSAEAPQLNRVRYRRIGGDICCSGWVENPATGS